MGDKPNVGGAAGQLVCTLRWEHPLDVVALGEFRIQGWMFEVPHQRGWIQETNGGYTKPAMQS